MAAPTFHIPEDSIIGARVGRDIRHTSAAFLIAARHAAEVTINQAIHKAQHDYRVATGGEILDMRIDALKHVDINDSGRRKHSTVITASVTTSFSKDL